MAEAHLWPSTNGPPVRESRSGASFVVPAAEPDRVALLSIWFKDHNNPRYAELLTRLERLDAMLLRLSDRRISRGIQFRALRWPRTMLLSDGAAARVEAVTAGLLTLDLEQVPGVPTARSSPTSTTRSSRRVRSGS